MNGQRLKDNSMEWYHLTQAELEALMIAGRQKKIEAKADNFVARWLLEMEFLETEKAAFAGYMIYKITDKGRNLLIRYYQYWNRKTMKEIG